MIWVLLAVVLVGSGTLITRWCLDFAEKVAEKSSEEPEPPAAPEPPDEAVDGIKIVGIWHEIEFKGRRYRRCTSTMAKEYCADSLGWLHYPEGTPLSTKTWYDVHQEYAERLERAQHTEVATAARKAWGTDTP